MLIEMEYEKREEKETTDWTYRMPDKDKLTRSYLLGRQPFEYVCRDRGECISYHLHPENCKCVRDYFDQGSIQKHKYMEAIKTKLWKGIMEKDIGKQDTDKR